MYFCRSNTKGDGAVKTDSKMIFGFWVYLMTDCLLFATLFATYLILHQKGAFPIDFPFALTETMLLLFSSFLCGIAILFAQEGYKKMFAWSMGLTFVLGVMFLFMEGKEFAHLIHMGQSWEQNASMSTFFTLVATHGCHIAVGLFGMIVLTGLTLRHGLTTHLLERWRCWSLFWHFLDVVWIFIFTVVYLREGI